MAMQVSPAPNVAPTEAATAPAPVQHMAPIPMVDWLCETLQIVTGGAPLAAAWAVTNHLPYASIITGVCAVAAYAGSRYLRLCRTQ